MKRLRFSLRDLLAAALGTKNAPSSSLRIAVPDEADIETASYDPALIEKQLADARKKAQHALGEWRSYPTQYYENAWAEASAKVQRLEARIAKRKAASGR